MRPKPAFAVSALFGKRGLTIGIGVIVALLAAAATGAVWTPRDVGAGTASAETVASVTLTPGTATSDLYPGRSGDVAVSIANTNTYQAYVGSLVLDTSRGTNGFSVSGGQSGCDPAAVSYTTQSNGGAGWFVPAGSTLDLDLTDAVDLGTGAASECQGATFIVYLLVAQSGVGAFGAGAAPRAPRISSAPLRPTVSTRATVAFDRTLGLAHECALDSNAYRACASPVTFTGLTRSLHVFRIRARNSTGTTSLASAYSWTVVPRRRRLQARPRMHPLLTTAPVQPWISRNATFAWLLQRSTKAECRLDAHRWKPCANLKTYLGLRLGTHVFRVRAKHANGGRSSVNRFVWTIVSGPAPSSPTITSQSLSEPSGAFTISGKLPGLLYPGARSPLRLTVSNPFDFDLRVTRLKVTVQPGSSKAGCDGPANLRVTQSNTAGGSVSIVVPARGSVRLPAQGATAPLVTMLDLPVSQDACKNAVFTFSYSGKGKRA